MKPIGSPYVLIMLAAAMICMFIALYVWLYRRKNSETIPLILLLAGIAEWIAAALMGLVDQNLTHKIIWAKIEYIGVVSVPLAVLGYVLQHSGSNQKLNIKRLAWLAVIPVATLVLAWTNGNHGLIWARYIPYQENGLVLSDKTYGPGFWVYWVYSYLVLLAATVITFRLTLVPGKIFRWQSILILIGILAPWVGNLLYVLHLDPFKNLDLTPLGFSITGILLATGMFRWRLFDIKPIAQAAVLTGMADGLLILDNQDRIVEVNPAAQDILGLGVQELVGKQMEQVIANLLPPGELSQQKREKTIEINLTNCKENRIYELNDSPFYEKHGTPGGRIIFLHDVTDWKHLEERLRETEQKLAEEALRESEEALSASEARFKSLVETQSDLIARSDLDGLLTFVNDAYCRTFGKTREELLGRSFSPTVFPEDQPTVTAMIKAIHLPPYHMQTETRHPTSSGIRWFSWDNAAVLDESGKIQELQGIGRDITDRKKAEEALQTEKANLEAIFESSPVAMFILDETTNIVQLNAAAVLMTGGSSSDSLQHRPGNALRCIHSSKDPRGCGYSKVCRVCSVRNGIEALIANGGTIHGAELVLELIRNGASQKVWMSVGAEPIQLNGRRHACVAMDDISERKQAEEEVRKLSAELEHRVIQRTTQLESTNKELEAFSYSVSHDLRSPLRGIDGWSLALLEDYGSQLDGQAKTYLERVRSETQRMGQLIDDLLQLSRLTSTEMTLGKVDLSAMAATIADQLQKAQPERQVEFVIQPGLNANGDPRLLEIALTNLLDNAFKFTGKIPQARIEFGQTEVEGQRAFFVCDNGAGFDMALAKKLFGAFQRMHKASDFPGTGVGLTTVQRIVHRHGGRIWAEAAVDQGASFYFTLEEIP